MQKTSKYKVNHIEQQSLAHPQTYFVAEVMAVVAIIVQMSLMGRNPSREGGSSKEPQSTSLGLGGIPGDSTSKGILDSGAGRVETLDDTLFVLVRTQETEPFSEVVFNDDRLCESCRLKGEIEDLLDD